jgi:hypothetical protein
MACFTAHLTFLSRMCVRIVFENFTRFDINKVTGVETKGKMCGIHFRMRASGAIRVVQ